MFFADVYSTLHATRRIARHPSFNQYDPRRAMPLPRTNLRGVNKTYELVLMRKSPRLYEGGDISFEFFFFFSEFGISVWSQNQMEFYD